jgi:outer membrane immunogenic protein
MASVDLFSALGAPMKRSLLGVVGAAALLIAGPLSTVNAADLAPRYAPPPPPPPPAASWTGCYVDAGYGYGFWDQNQFQETFPGLAVTSANVDSGGRGWLGRFGGGCDYQFGLGGLGNFVIGVLGDYDFMGLRGQMSPGDTTLVGNENESGAWYVGGRIGYLVTPNLLTYFDGGWTQTHFDQVNFNLLPPPFGPSTNFLASNTYNGWFLGGGTEYALNFSWMPIHGLFWRNEWRYSSYNSADLPIFFTTGAAATTGMHVNSLNVQTITSSLVWRFNWWGQ